MKRIYDSTYVFHIQMYHYFLYRSILWRSNQKSTRVLCDVMIVIRVMIFNCDVIRFDTRTRF